MLFFHKQFTNRRAYPPVHTHAHHWQSDGSFAWVFSLSGLELAGTSLRVQESKTPGSGWAPQEEVTLKGDAGRCFCCLPPGGSTGQGVARTHPSPSCWNMPAGSPCGPWAITVIVTIQGEVPGGLSTPESGSTACAATENENTGTRPSPPEFQQQPSTPSGLPVLRCLRPDGFLTQPTHAGEKKPVAFFFDLPPAPYL